MNMGCDKLESKKIVKRLKKKEKENKHKKVWEGPLWYGNHNTYSDYGATDSSSDNAGGNWNTCDLR